MLLCEVEQKCVAARAAIDRTEINMMEKHSASNDNNLLHHKTQIVNFSDLFEQRYELILVNFARNRADINLKDANKRRKAKI